MISDNPCQPEGSRSSPKSCQEFLARSYTRILSQDDRQTNRRLLAFQSNQLISVPYWIRVCILQHSFTRGHSFICKSSTARISLQRSSLVAHRLYPNSCIIQTTSEDTSYHGVLSTLIPIIQASPPSNMRTSLVLTFWLSFAITAHALLRRDFEGPENRLARSRLARAPVKRVVSKDFLVSDLLTASVTAADETAWNRSISCKDCS